MAHRTLVALALGLLALAGGCMQSSDPEPAAPQPQLVEFSSIATIDTLKLTFCCDPEAQFPQVIGTFRMTRPVDSEVEVTQVGELAIVSVVEHYLDAEGNVTDDAELADKVVETYGVSANACPPASGWKCEIKVTDSDGDYAFEDVPIENTCPPAGDPPVELTCGTLPDQVWVTQGPIVNVTTLVPVLVVGTNEGACDGTVAGGLGPILPPFSPASYGAVFLRHVPSNTQAALGYGPNGIALRGYGTDWGFTLVDPAIQGVDRNTTDAIPTANDPDSAEAIVTRYGRNRVETWRYDTTDESFTDVDTLDVTLFPGATGNMISACRPEVDGPLYVLFNSAASQLYVKDDPDDLVTPAVLVTTLGNDGRRVRHEGDLLFVDCFADDTLAVLDPAATTPVVATVTVGDGPIGIDTEPLPSGNIAVLTTGFNDHTFTITIVEPNGTLVSSTTEAVVSGGLNPGSGVILPDGKVAVSCNGSGRIFVWAAVFDESEE